MAESTRLEPFFLADNSALDFLNSIAAPSGETIEWINNGRALTTWLDRAGLVPCEILEKFDEETTKKKLDAIAAEARELREWFREFIITNAGQHPEPSVLGYLDKLNHLLERDAFYRQIDEGQPLNTRHNNTKANGAEPVPSLQMREHRRWNAPKDLLLPIVEAMAELICRTDFDRIRNCEGPTCTLWFLDISKNHTRRWCSMEICGNRAKAAAHRIKKRGIKHK